MTMRHVAFALTFLAWAHGRRVQTSVQLLSSSFNESKSSLKSPDAIFTTQSLAEVRKSNEEPSLWQSADVQRVLKFLCIIAVGKLLQVRFPKTDVITKLLLQCLLPAVLFKGLSQQKLELGHMAYLAGGVFVILVRVPTSMLVSYAVFGCSSQPGSKTTLRRTAIFEMSSMGSALSVLPFVGEFIGGDFVGLGAVVDVPMKVYILIFMPFFARMCGEKTDALSSGNQGGKTLGYMAQLLTDPMTMSVVLGIIFALLTDGAGTQNIGFVGQAIDTLAAGQAPCLFLLIGLNMTFSSSTPIFCVVLLLASHGVLLIITWILLLVVNPGDTLARFIILFAQGSPMFAVAGVLSGAISSGVQGYSPSFALDIVGMSYPISSFMQCFAGIMGSSYQPAIGIIGVILITIAAVLRIIFKGRFEESLVLSK